MNFKLPSWIRKLRPGLLLILAVYVVAITSWGVAVQYPADGLDASWQQALVDATDHRRAFGTEVVFTYGPLHQAATSQGGAHWTAFWLGRILFALSWLVIVLLSGRLFGLRVALGIAAAVSLTPVTEVHFYLLAFLGVVLGFRLHTRSPDAGGSGFLLACTLASACSLATLVKVSFIGATAPAILVLVGLPALRIMLRQEPFSLRLIGLVVTPPALMWLVWGLTVNWSPGAFLNYFLGPNLEIVRGYTSAMSYAPTGAAWTLVGIFALRSLYALGFLWKLQARDDLRGPVFAFGLSLAGWVVLLAFGVLSWVVFKTSYVRGDPGHMQIAAYWGLGVLIVLLALPSARLSAIWRENSRALCAVVFLSPFALGAVVLPTTDARPAFRWIKQRLVGSVENFQLLTVPGRRAADASRTAALDRIRAEAEDFAIPAGASADIVPWDISILLANRLRYSPRPIPQSYSVYTASLQQLNRDFVLHSPAKPEYYILRVGDIEDRLLIGLDSALVLNLRQSYDYSHRSNRGSLIFRRKSTTAGPVARVETLDRAALTWSAEGGGTRWTSSRIELPAEEGVAVVLQASFRDGLARSLLTKLYRPFPVYLQYLDGAGEVLESFRFFPDAAEEYMIYPILKTEEDLLGILYPDKATAKGVGAVRARAVRFTVTDVSYPFAASDFRLLAYHFPPAPAPAR